MKKLIEKICKNNDTSKIAGEPTDPKTGLMVVDKIGICTDTRRLLIVNTDLAAGWYENGDTKKDCPGKFADYSRAIPTNIPTVSFSMRADKLLDAVKCASTMARYQEPLIPGMNKRAKAARITANNMLRIEIKDNQLILSSSFHDHANKENDVELTESIMPVWGVENNGTYKFASDCNYLMDFLKAAKKENVLVECFKPSYPFIMSVPGAKYICMPMAY